MSSKNIQPKQPRANQEESKTRAPSNYSKRYTDENDEENVSMFDLPHASRKNKTQAVRQDPIIAPPTYNGGPAQRAQSRHNNKRKFAEFSSSNSSKATAGGQTVGVRTMLKNIKNQNDIEDYQNAQIELRAQQTRRRRRTNGFQLDTADVFVDADELENEPQILTNAESLLNIQSRMRQSQAYTEEVVNMLQRNSDFIVTRVSQASHISHASQAPHTGQASQAQFVNPEQAQGTSSRDISMIVDDQKSPVGDIGMLEALLQTEAETTGRQNPKTQVRNQQNTVTRGPFRKYRPKTTKKP